MVPIKASMDQAGVPSAGGGGGRGGGCGFESFFGFLPFWLTLSCSQETPTLGRISVKPKYDLDLSSPYVFDA